MAQWVCDYGLSRYKIGAGAAAHEKEHATALEVYGWRLDELRGRPEEIARLIACERDAEVKETLRLMADRAAFARDLLGFEPDLLQEEALRSSSRRLMFNCNRQWGKSTIAAIRALHRAWFWPGSQILLVSRAHAQSGGVLEKIKAFLPELGIGSKGDGLNRQSIKFPNGSRVIALPGGPRPTRGHSRVSLVIIDEAGMVPDAVHDAVAPTLAMTNGDLLLSSTPMGKRGAFYRAWQYGGAEWHRIFGPFDEANPGRISREHVESERRRGGDDFVAQEYLCQFLDRDSHLFGEDSMEKLFTHDIASWE
jgi:hypothetical protein